MMPTTHSNFNRRNFLSLAGLSAGGLYLAGCAKGTGAGPAAANTITTAAWTDTLTDVMYGPIADGFAAASGIKLQSQASVAFSDYQTRFRTLLAGGEPPDVMELNDDFVREVTDKKLTKDLAPYLEKSSFDISEYFEKTFNFTKRPNGQRALAIGALSRCIFYNKTMFEKEGITLPPTSWSSDGWKWDDFLETAKGLTKGTERYGVVLVKDTAYENTWSYNNGGPGTFSEDGTKFTLADPEGLEAIQWVADLALKHKVAPAYGEIQPDQAEQRLFTAGKLGMILSPSSSIGYYAENVKDFEWDIAPVPGNVRQVQEGGFIIYVIPEKAKNPDQAWEYLNYAIGPEGGKAFAEAGLLVPVNRKAAESLKSPGGSPKNIQLLAEAFDHSQSINSTPATAAAVAIYRPQLQRAFTGEILVKEALSSVRSQVETAIAGG